MVKRYIATFLAAVMFLTLPLSVFATEGGSEILPTPKLYAEAVTVPQGQSDVLVPLRFENVVDYAHLSAKLIYDNALVLSDIILNPEAEQNLGVIFEAAVKSFTYDESSMRRAFTWDMPEGGVDGSFIFAYASFIIPEGTPAGVYSIDITYEPFESYDANEEDYRINIVQSSVTITEVANYGDVNNDDAVTFKDVARIINRLAGFDTEIDLVAADVNLDKELDFKDVYLILRNLAGWPNARLGHRDVTETVIAPTCSQPGKSRVTCSICGDWTEYPASVIDHIYENGSCTMCGTLSPDHPLISYCDHLKYNAPYDENLRGYSKYVTEKFDSYSIFTSNIYDDKTDSLCIFGTINFDSGLYASVSIDIETLHPDGKYEFYYECYVGDTVAATMSGTVGPTSGVSDMTVTKYTGDESMQDEHMQIASPVIGSCYSFTAKMLEESPLEYTIDDFNIKLG